MLDVRVIVLPLVRRTLPRRRGPKAPVPATAWVLEHAQDACRTQSALPRRVLGCSPPRSPLPAARPTATRHPTLPATQTPPFCAACRRGFPGPTHIPRSSPPDCAFSNGQSTSAPRGLAAQTRKPASNGQSTSALRGLAAQTRKPASNGQSASAPRGLAAQTRKPENRPRKGHAAAAASQSWREPGTVAR